MRHRVGADLPARLLETAELGPREAVELVAVRAVGPRVDYGPAEPLSVRVDQARGDEDRGRDAEPLEVTEKLLRAGGRWTISQNVAGLYPRRKSSETCSSSDSGRIERPIGHVGLTAW